MWIFIRPLDTVFCRDGRPFIAGEGTVAKSIFPPMPSTFYGAIRTAILAENNKTFSGFHRQKEPYSDLPEVGTYGHFGSLEIRGPWIATKNKVADSFRYYFPLPANLVQDKKNKRDELFTLKPDGNDISTAEATDLCESISLLQGPEGVIIKNPKGYLINIEGAKKILAWNKSISFKNDLKSSDDSFRMSYQIGLARSFGARTAEEGKLYSAGHYQTASFSKDLPGFMLRVMGSGNLPERGILKLGGESRAAVYEIIKDRPFNEPIFEDTAEWIAKNNRFFLWLLTPAIFPHGYLPSFIDQASMKGKLSGINLRLAGCQLGRKQYIGGFKMKKGSGGKSKNGYRAVPSGSVYFFEIVNKPNQEEINTLVKERMFGTIDGQIDNMAKQGFGTTLIGGY